MSIQYAGGTNINATFTNDGTKGNIQGNVVTQLLAAGWSQATGPAGGGSQAVTVSIASPGVVSLAAHGLLANDSWVFSTTGALPTGFTAGTQYFIKTVLSSGTFTLSTSAGGTVINTTGTQSGTHSGVGSVRMATAATPWSVTARVKIQDNGGSCLTFSIENSNSSLAGLNTTNNGGYLLPAVAKSFRIIADKYQAFVFMPITTTARGYVAFGTPYLPTFLQGVLTECGWMQSNGTNDSSVGLSGSFRTVVRPPNGGTPNYQGIANGSLIDNGNQTTGNAGTLGLVLAVAPNPATGQSGTHWHDASAFFTEPLIVWATSAVSGEALIRGQLWDALVICDTFTGDTTTAYDSHNWWGITDNNTTDKATLFVVVP